MPKAGGKQEMCLGVLGRLLRGIGFLSGVIKMF